MSIPPLVLLGSGSILVLVGLSAFFSSAESAIFSLQDSWVAERATTEDTRAGRLATLRADPHRLLVTILVGNNIVNVAITAIMTAVFVSQLPPGLAVTATTVLASFIVLVFGEIVPKSYGLGHAEEWALTIAVPLVVAERALYPLVAFFDLITRRINDVLGGRQEIEEPLLDAGP